MMTPRDVHTGEADDITWKRQETMNAKYDRHPERFVKGQRKLNSLSRGYGSTNLQPFVESQNCLVSIDEFHT